MEISDNTWINFAVAAVSGGAATAIIQSVVNRRRSKAEINAIDAKSEIGIANTAFQMIDRLQKSLKDLEEKIHKLEQSNQELNKRVSDLDSHNQQLASDLQLKIDKSVELEKVNNALLRTLTETRLKLDDCLEKVPRPDSSN